MSNLIKAEVYKIIKAKGFKVICIIAILFGIMTAALNNMITAKYYSALLGEELTEQQINELYNVDDEDVVAVGQLGFSSSGAENICDITPLETFHSAFGIGVMEIFITILVGISLAKEYSEGTIKNTLAYGKKRTNFYIAKFIALFLSTAIVTAIMTFTAMILLTILKGWNQSFEISQIVELIRTYAGAMMVYAGIIAFMMLVSILVQSNGATIGIGIVVLDLIPVIVSLLYGHYNWFDKIFESSLYYNAALATAIRASASDIIKASIVGLITALVFGIIGIKIFQKQDVK